jgi:signal transduction histidine kinase
MIRAWLALAAVAVLIIAGTVMLTVSTVRAERQRAGDERLRQALWRLDGRATELLLSAAAHSAESPGQLRCDDLILAHLEVDADGLVVAAAGIWPGDALPPALAALRNGLSAPGGQLAEQALPALQQQASLDNGYSSRSGNAQRLQIAVLARTATPSGPVVARWAAGSLVLARHVRRDGDDLVQAAVIDWPRLQREFAAAIEDILPQAVLQPADERDPRPDQLAALPARVVGGPPPALPDGVLGMLAAAWGAVGIGLLGAVAALAAAHRLAERRATFVSAVTHELRTPLTALRLHADLVADERVGGDPVRRAGAVQILRGEAARLSRLVDNVLDYARLERRRPPRLESTDLAVLLPQLLPAVSARLSEAGMLLEAGTPGSVRVRCDADAVGRILLNLADNAAKYGAGPVRLEVAVAAGRAELRLRDHGPGIPEGLRLFVPFSRSAEAAAGSAPGVGLGLALCRRLARAQGGDLRLERPADGPGACAVLTLALDRASVG